MVPDATVADLALVVAQTEAACRTEQALFATWTVRIATWCERERARSARLYVERVNAVCVCRDCPQFFPKRALYPDEGGSENRLCAEHARAAGSYDVRNPCRDCRPDCKVEASCPDDDGTPNQLCDDHARIILRDSMSFYLWLLRAPKLDMQGEGHLRQLGTRDTISKCLAELE